MRSFIYTLQVLVSVLTVAGWALPAWAQSPPQPALQGRFMTDSIEIGRPFQYALTYWHSPRIDVLFPDTATSFRPYRVQKITVFPTQTTGTGASAVSRDSAVYTLVSFDTDTVQVLRVPLRSLNSTDCTAHWTPTDTVFLQSKLSSTRLSQTRSRPLRLATETKLAPLSQQFNYPALATGLLLLSASAALLYGLFGRAIRRQWQLHLLDRRHLRFLRNYNQLGRRIDSFTATETANEAVVMWKMYLEQLERRTYQSLTTPELAERIDDKRLTDALREADRMIYGGAFSPQSQAALYVLRDVATQAYHRSRTRLQRSVELAAKPIQQPDSAETSFFS